MRRNRHSHYVERQKIYSHHSNLPINHIRKAYLVIETCIALPLVAKIQPTRTTKKRYELSKEINELSKNLGEKFSDVLRQKSKEYKPLNDDIIDESSANDHLIDQYYEQSSIMIAIENKLRQITKEN